MRFSLRLLLATFLATFGFESQLTADPYVNPTSPHVETDTDSMPNQSCKDLETHKNTWMCLNEISTTNSDFTSYDVIQYMCQSETVCRISAVVCNSKSAQPSTPVNPRFIFICGGAWFAITYMGDKMEHMACNEPGGFDCNFEKVDTFTPAEFEYYNLGPNEDFARNQAISEENLNRCRDCHNPYPDIPEKRMLLDPVARDLPQDRLLRLRDIKQEAIGSCRYGINTVKCDPKPAQGSLQEFYCALKGLQNRKEDGCYTRDPMPSSEEGPPMEDEEAGP